MKKRKDSEKQPRKKNKDRREELRKKAKRYLHLLVIFVFFVACSVLLLVNRWMDRKYKAEYVQQDVASANDGEDFSDAGYHFYLDFSPSMRGFMKEGPNSNMAVLADVLQRFDHFGSEQALYWCDDEITNVSSRDFYASMSGIQTFNDRNNQKYNSIENESGGQEAGVGERMEQMIRDIDLSDVFSRRYDDGMAYSEEEGDLNVIITDLNFMKEGDEQSQEELSKRFADSIASSARLCNVSIYQIYSRFSGEAIDAARIYGDESDEMANAAEDLALYIIILSGNDEAYQDFTAYLERELAGQGVDVSNKFELPSKFGDGRGSLALDLKRLLAMNLIENKNLNFDNESFKNLQSNAIAMRLVKGQGASVLNMCVAPVDLPGYSYNDPDTADGSKLEAKVRLYHPMGGKKYEEGDGTDLIKSRAAGLEWVQEQMYLRLRLELDSEAADSELSRGFGWWKNIAKREYFVLDIQFFMEEPSYALPSWAESGEQSGIPVICQEIIESKEAACADLDEASRYLGSMVIYVIY